MNLTPPSDPVIEPRSLAVRQKKKQRDVLIDKGTGGANPRQQYLRDRTKRKERWWCGVMLEQRHGGRHQVPIEGRQILHGEP